MKGEKVSITDEKEICTLYDSEIYSTKELGEMFSINSSTIRVVLKRNGRELRPRALVIPKEKQEIAISMYENGSTFMDISRAINHGEATIRYFLKIYHGYKPESIKIPHDECLEICMLYETDTKVIAELAKKTGRSISAIRKIIKDYIPNSNPFDRVHRKYSLDEHFFKVIDNEAKAYFLGFLYADGCVTTNRAEISISLQERDGYILDKFKQSLQSTRPIIYEDRSKKKGNSQNISTLNINSGYIKEDLLKLGCTPQKSFTSKFPTTDQVPKEFQRDFIRGFFDGDGCISGTSVSFTGTLEFLAALQDILIQELGFRKTKLTLITKMPESNLRTLSYGGTIQSTNFGKWIYKDATIFLSRKKDKFDKIKIIRDRNKKTI